MKNSYNDLSYEELISTRESLQNEYRDTRFNMVVGHVDNPLALRTLRRRLARLNTIIHEHDTRIRQR